MPVFGLPKESILRGHKAFSDIIARGRSLTAGSIRLFYATGDKSSQPSVGFSVSRTIRKATVRNRIKRCLREAVRQNKSILLGLQGLPGGKHTLVFMYRGTAANHPSKIVCRNIEEDLLAALKSLLNKLKS